MTVRCPTCDCSFEKEHYMKIHHAQSHNESIAGVETVCEKCGTEFRQCKDNHENRNNDFCSRDCYSIWLSDNNINEEHPNYNSVTVECQSCGSALERQPNELERNNNNFCDEDCYAEYQKESMSGESNPNYNPDYNADYGENWQNIREVVLERDFSRCRCCGISDESHKQENGIGLDIHHRTPISYFDSTKRANRLDNLITFCRKCHVNIESNITNVS